jgi:lactate dehydrogenase-like 2-hydroxyacid dehydrogenase
VNILPDNASTRNYVNARRLRAASAARASTIVGRGSTVDEHALLEALRRAGSARRTSIVFETEPLPPTARSGNCRTASSRRTRQADANDQDTRIVKHFLCNLDAFSGRRDGGSGGVRWSDRRSAFSDQL